MVQNQTPHRVPCKEDRAVQNRWLIERKWISSAVNNEHHTQSSPTRSCITKAQMNRKEGKRREKEIDKMTCENKHQSMERNGEEISCQNETHHSHPTNATEEILYEHLSFSPYNTATPQPHSPRSRWAAATAPLYGQSDIAQPAYVHCQTGRKNGKYTYSRQKQILSEDRKIAPPMTNSHMVVAFCQRQ